jgi:hypothetical protein
LHDQLDFETTKNTLDELCELARIHEAPIHRIDALTYCLLLDVSRQERERCPIKFQLKTQIEVLKNFDTNGPFPRAILTYLDESKRQLDELCSPTGQDMALAPLPVPEQFYLDEFVDIIFGSEEEPIELVAKAIRLVVSTFFTRTDLRGNFEPYVLVLQKVANLCPPSTTSDKSSLTTLDGMIRESLSKGRLNLVKYLKDCRGKVADAVTANVHDRAGGH